MADNDEISVVPAALLTFGLPAAVQAAGFGSEATALEAVTFPADAFGTIRASAAVANAAGKARDVLANDFRQAMQAAGFLAEAVPAAAQNYVWNDHRIGSNYLAIGGSSGASPTTTSIPLGLGLPAGGPFAVP